jgi:serine/threonine protein kinase
LLPVVARVFDPKLQIGVAGHHHGHAATTAPSHAGAVAPTTGSGTGPPSTMATGGGGVGVINININTPPAVPTLINISVSSDTKNVAAAAAAAATAGGVNPRDIYEVLRSLRKTIFGHLCLARHRTTGQLVAVKLSELTRMAQLRTCEDPRAECRLLRLVTGHRYVVSLLGEYQCERYHWCVYEFVDGGDFFGFVEATGKLGDEASRIYFRQLCDGLSYLHAHGLCHLDLKPDNLLFTRNKEIKICDFGMARELKYAKPLPPHLAAKMEDPNLPPKNYFQGQVYTLHYTIFTM